MLTAVLFGSVMVIASFAQTKTRSFGICTGHNAGTELTLTPEGFQKTMSLEVMKEFDCKFFSWSICDDRKERELSHKVW